jgi:hypothetical protein
MKLTEKCLKVGHVRLTQRHSPFIINKHTPVIRYLTYLDEKTSNVQMVVFWVLAQCSLVEVY